mmetsp:Transcript_23785/g.76288  ORF Transcript_23785/g.76288 Transcript_23785/m.76288 type:complete len:241 (+) Transcript_23785:459-1181(+)
MGDKRPAHVPRRFGVGRAARRARLRHRAPRAPLHRQLDDDLLAQCFVRRVGSGLRGVLWRRRARLRQRANRRGPPRAAHGAAVRRADKTARGPLRPRCRAAHHAHRGAHQRAPAPVAQEAGHLPRLGAEGARRGRAGPLRLHLARRGREPPRFAVALQAVAQVAGLRHPPDDGQRRLLPRRPRARLLDPLLRLGARHGVPRHVVGARGVALRPHRRRLDRRRRRRGCRVLVRKVGGVLEV